MITVQDLTQDEINNFICTIKDIKAFKPNNKAVSELTDKILIITEKIKKKMGDGNNANLCRAK